MRASHVALLSAAPVFAAPISSYFKARSQDGGAALSARDSSDCCTEDTLKEFLADPLSNFNARSMGGGAALGARGSPVCCTEERLTNFIRDSHVNFNARSKDGGAALSARDSHYGYTESKRDVTYGQLLDARDDAEDLVNSIIGSRDSNPNNGSAKVLNALESSRRDVTSDELAARDDWEDSVKMLNALNARELGFKRDMQARGPSLLTSFLAWLVHKLMSLPIRHRDLTPEELAGRNTVDSDSILDAYMSDHATREPSPQQETQAHGIADGPTGTVARDGSATNTFIDALLDSRDSSNSLTADDVLSLASLANRALDEID